MSQFTRTTTVDSSPGADTTKAAVIDVDTDLTGIVAAYNAHDTATSNVHGSTGAATGTGAMVRATSPALVTPALGTPASGNLANCTGVPLNSQATAENDVLVGAPTPFGSWVKKTIAEFKTILGLGTAAYTASTAYDAAGTAAGKIASSISDGDTTHAPDGNSVFDALALKAPKTDTIKGDGTAGRVLRSFCLRFTPGGTPNTNINIQNNAVGAFNIPTFSTAVNLTASATVGSFTLSADGKIITMDITPNSFIGVLSVSILASKVNTAGTVIYPTYADIASGSLQVSLTDKNAVSIDWRTLLNASDDLYVLFSVVTSN